jgi:hypothetical protein
LNGLIYVHRISDPKMGKISKRNLRMFKQLCGDGSLRNVCITTTNWDRVTKEEGDMKEQELRESPNLLRPLINEGARLARHDKGIMSARSIVNYLIHKDPTKLQIQIELDAGKTLEETSTGAILHEEILALKAKQEAELLGLKEEMEAAAREMHAELLAELEEERQKSEAQRKKMEEDLENLKMQARSDKVEYEEKIRHLEDKMAMDAKQIEAELLSEHEAHEELERNNCGCLELLKQQAQRDNLKDKHEVELEEEGEKREAPKKKMEENLENLKMQARSDKEKHEENTRHLEDKMTMDVSIAKQKEAELLAEREVREKLERNKLDSELLKPEQRKKPDQLQCNKEQEGWGVTGGVIVFTFLCVAASAAFSIVTAVVRHIPK